MITAENIPAILAAIGGNWTRKTKDHDGRPESVAEAIREDGLEIHFRFGGWKAEYRLSVHACFASPIPQHVSRSLVEMASYDERHAVTTGITLSLDKSPEKAGTEIARRLITPLEPLMVKACEWVARHYERESKAEEWRARILAASNGHLNTQEGEKYQQHVRTVWRSSGPEVDLESHYNDGTFKIAAKALTEEQVCALLAILFPTAYMPPVPEPEEELTT
ncbi:MAG TPA: hypothetical protein DCZ95_07535 [Verrucomicrobia bacterium]|nr:MAG: hypothetical protein A2X46_16420 [Lentisphaerae bacterium GWF2_57_35]HBA83927.1 hypothetical protein [Verrucomicrobiota bacterium]